MSMKTLQFSCALLFIPFAVSLGADYFGQVIEVIEGDLLIVRINGQPKKIRLFGADCPEVGQNFSKEAKYFTKEKTLKRHVLVRTYGEKNGIIKGEIVFENGKNLNRQIVGAGLAWHTDKYSEATADLKILEHEAKFYRHGLWSEPHPVPPWNFGDDK